jgi:hypothetical protein
MGVSNYKSGYPPVDEGRVHMGDTTSDILDQADEEILTYTVSDEALEAASDTERGVNKLFTDPTSKLLLPCC